MKDRASHYQKIANDAEIELIKAEKAIKEFEKVGLDVSGLKQSQECFKRTSQYFSERAQVEMVREELEEMYE